MLEVGDKILISNVFTTTLNEITRVTKTLALSKREDGYEQRFYRKTGKTYPKARYDQNTYKIIRKNK